jgi:hypothetical protein
VHASGIPTVGIVGTAFTARAELPTGLFYGTVVSAPVGSSAAWSGADFSPDAAGVYVLRAYNGASPVFTDTSGTPSSYNTSGAAVIEFSIVSFPAEALTTDLIADRNRFRRGPPSDPARGWYNPNGLAVDPRPMAERYALLNRIARYGFAPSVYAALDASTPIPLGMAWPPSAWD